MDGARPYHLLFVCTANICRSPMAEGLARDYAERRGWAVECASAGMMGIVGKEAAANAVYVLQEVGIDISRHRSQGLDSRLVDWADHILVMELNHAIQLRERYPHLDDKILQLASFGSQMEIRDPYRSWRWRFRRSRDELRRCVEAFLDNLPPRPA